MPWVTGREAKPEWDFGKQGNEVVVLRNVLEDFKEISRLYLLGESTIHIGI